MATTIRTKIASAAVAAAVAMTGFAPAAHADLLGILGGGLSISAGEESDYAPSATRVSDNSGYQEALNQELSKKTPMAANYRAEHRAPSTIDLLDNRNLASSPDGTVEIWGTNIQRTRALEIATLVNEHRARNGESTLRLDAAVSESAQAWAEQMARYHWFEHDPGSKKLGEIIAMRYDIDRPDTAARFLDQWENSPSHKRIMHLDGLRTMGVGIAEDPKTGEVYAVVRVSYQ